MSQTETCLSKVPASLLQSERLGWGRYLLCCSFHPRSFTLFLPSADWLQDCWENILKTSPCCKFSCGSVRSESLAEESRLLPRVPLTTYNLVFCLNFTSFFFYLCWLLMDCNLDLSWFIIGRQLCTCIIGLLLNNKSAHLGFFNYQQIALACTIWILTWDRNLSAEPATSPPNNPPFPVMSFPGVQGDPSLWGMNRNSQCWPTLGKCPSWMPQRT